MGLKDPRRNGRRRPVSVQQGPRRVSDLETQDVVHVRCAPQVDLRAFGAVASKEAAARVEGQPVPQARL
eukprot:8097446-Lingulodinium_polyedra.AAC.1